MIYISFDIGVKNLAVCILQHDVDNNKLNIIDWNVICLADKKHALNGASKANHIADILFCELDNLVGKLQCIDINFIDKVMIENQPSNLNGIMKTIQYLIFSYFELLRHWDKVVGQTILINPVHKLLNHDYKPVSKQCNVATSNKVDRREKYKQNKLDSIDICRHYLRENDVLLLFFNSHKKKDDLADTCIQTISYIRKNGNLVDNLHLHINNYITNQ